MSLQRPENIQNADQALNVIIMAARDDWENRNKRDLNAFSDRMTQIANEIRGQSNEKTARIRIFLALNTQSAGFIGWPGVTTEVIREQATQHGLSYDDLLQEARGQLALERFRSTANPIRPPVISEDALFSIVPDDPALVGHESHTHTTIGILALLKQTALGNNPMPPDQIGTPAQARAHFRRIYCTQLLDAPTRLNEIVETCRLIKLTAARQSQPDIDEPINADATRAFLNFD